MIEDRGKRAGVILDSEPVKRFRHRFLLCISIFIPLFLSGCNRGRGRVLEIAYVSAVQANLRDHVAAVYEKAGVVKNGERVEVLDHDRRFVKVRSADGTTGWMEQRYLVSQEVFDLIQKLTADNQNDPVQARGATRNDTNLHVEPGRETEHLYQISSSEKLSLLKRGTAEKPGAVAALSRSTSHSGMPASNPKNSNLHDKDKKQPVPAVPAPGIEKSWPVRDCPHRVGWVLARHSDL